MRTAVPVALSLVVAPCLAGDGLRASAAVQPRTLVLIGLSNGENDGLTA